MRHLSRCAGIFLVAVGFGAGGCGNSRTTSPSATKDVTTANDADTALDSAGGGEVAGFDGAGNETVGADTAIADAPDATTDTADAGPTGFGLGETTAKSTLPGVATDLAIDSVRGLAWAACTSSAALAGSQNALVAVNAAGDVSGTIALGDASKPLPQVLAIIPDLSKLYVADQTTGGITVYDTDLLFAFRKLALTTPRLAADPATRRIFVPTQDMTGAWSVTVVDGLTDTPGPAIPLADFHLSTGGPTDSDGIQLAIDPLSGAAYVYGADGKNAPTIWVIDGAKNAVTTTMAVEAAKATLGGVLALDSGVLLAATNNPGQLDVLEPSPPQHKPLPAGFIAKRIMAVKTGKGTAVFVYGRDASGAIAQVRFDVDDASGTVSDAWPASGVNPSAIPGSAAAGVSARALQLGDGSSEIVIAQDDIEARVLIPPPPVAQATKLTVRRLGAGSAVQSGDLVRLGDTMTTAAQAFTLLEPNVSRQLVAIAAPGWAFAGWSDDAASCGNNVICNVKTTDAGLATLATANFSPAGSHVALRGSLDTGIGEAVPPTVTIDAGANTATADITELFKPDPSYIDGHKFSWSASPQGQEIRDDTSGVSLYSGSVGLPAQSSPAAADIVLPPYLLVGAAGSIGVSNSTLVAAPQCPPGSDGSYCTDFNACTEPDTCVGGKCVGGPGLVCPQPVGNPCIIDVNCNFASGECDVFGYANGVSCPAVGCSSASVCQSGSCVSTVPKQCPAANDCVTLAYCDTSSGACVQKYKFPGTACKSPSNPSAACSCGDLGSCVCGTPQPPCEAPPTVLPTDDKTGLASDFQGGIGATIQLAGENLYCGTALTTVEIPTISGTAAEMALAVTPTSTLLQVVVPDGAISGEITVTTEAGSAQWPFKVTGYAPEISDAEPNPAYLSEPITISGTHLGGPLASIWFNNQSWASAKASGDDNSIVAIVPANATSGPVTVSTPGGTGTSTQSVALLKRKPAITDVSPLLAKAGDAVTVTGTDLIVWDASIQDTASGSTATFTIDTVTSTPTELHLIAPALASHTFTGPLTVNGQFSDAKSTQVLTILEEPPTGISFQPASGKPGDVVKVYVTPHDAVTAISFPPGVTATFAADTSGYFPVTIPDGAATGPISVTSPSGTGASASDFTVLQKPQIIDFEPKFANPPGTQVWVTFKLPVPDYVTVAFTTPTGFVNATFIDKSDDGNTFVVASPYTAITGPIRITSNLAGTALSTENFVTPPLPVITDIVPSTGAPGDLVTIHGFGFAATLGDWQYGGTPVNFPGGYATILASSLPSDTSIVVAVPDYASTGSVSYTNPTTQQVGTGPVFTGLPAVAPQITSVTPSHAMPGDVVTITGSGLDGLNASVTFTYTQAVVIAGDNASIQVAVPLAMAGDKNLSVATPAGSASYPTAFTVDTNIAPTILSVSTTATDVETLFTITGTHLGGMSAIVNDASAGGFKVLTGDQSQLTVIASKAASGPLTVSTVLYGYTDNGGTATAPISTTFCVPSCGQSTCGDDGCGGTCGTCVAGKSCTPTSQGGPTFLSCLPTDYCANLAAANCCISTTLFSCVGGTFTAAACSNCQWDTIATAYMCNTGSGSDPSGAAKRLCSPF